MADTDEALPGEESWVWQPAVWTRKDGTRVDVLVAFQWDEKEAEFTEGSPCRRAVRDMDGKLVNTDRDGSVLVSPPRHPDADRQRREAGDRFWDIVWVGPGQRGESGPTVLNGSPYLVKVRSTEHPLGVAQVQLSLLDVSAVQEALGTSDGAVLLDLLDEVSPDEIRRALPNLPGPARDFDLVLSQDAVARLIERARRGR